MLHPGDLSSAHCIFFLPADCPSAIIMGFSSCSYKYHCSLCEPSFPLSPACLLSRHSLQSSLLNLDTAPSCDLWLLLFPCFTCTAGSRLDPISSLQEIFLKPRTQPLSSASVFRDSPLPASFIYRQLLHLTTEVATWGIKESYMDQNSLELKLPLGSSPPFYAKQRTRSPEGNKKKKWTLRLITPSSQLVQPLADLQNSLPQPFKR